MVQPETTFSGGLSDRLRGITSIYGECKRKNLPFKIVFEPLHLQDYFMAFFIKQKTSQSKC